MKQVSFLISSAGLCCLSSGFLSPSSRKSAFLLHLTSDEILDRAREKLGLPNEEAAPRLFDDDLLNEMQQSLLTLERRVKDGPKALSSLDVEELNGQLQRIVHEMKLNRNKMPEPVGQARDDDVNNVARPSEPTSNVSPQQQAFSQQASLLHADPDAILNLRAPSASSEIVDTSLDEGPFYDGNGGMGQPKGTVNTYVIPGMHEMSPEEYRDALQRSVIERQTRRRASGTVGNKSSEDYLNSLKN